MPISEQSLQNKVILRLAEADDLPEMFKIVDTYDGDILIDSNKVKNSLRDMVYMQGVIIAYYNDVSIGAVAGYVFPSMYNDDLMFHQMFFYVKKEYRALTIQFIKELELVLIPTKVNKIVMGIPMHTTSKETEQPQHDKLLRFYKMLGYKVLETHVFKQL